jgi:predicted MPP superfamily phosphohydrolase
MSRRQFLSASAGAALAGPGVAGYAFGPAASAVELSRHDVPVAGLPESLHGIRIAQLTDVHFPANHRAARRALAILAEERPEIVVFTGDLIERLFALDDMVAFVREARGSLATVAVRGNWEISAGVSPGTLRAAYGDAGVEYLQNESVSIRVGQAHLGIAGLDDTVNGSPHPERALQRMSSADAVLWALHGPGFADAMPEGIRADLLLAGHTHGGQIRLPFLPGLRPSGSGRFLAGWYSTAAAPLYVSRGIGTTAIRARLFCPPELPIFTLVRPAAPRAA